MNVTNLLTRDKRISSRLFLIVSLLILISMACNLPSMAKTAGSQDSARHVETSIAETLEARNQGDGQDTVDQGAEGEDQPLEDAARR